MENRLNITLSLGGGGARGLAHLGVYEVLKEHQFNINRILGISIGSLVGGMIAFEPDPRKVRAKAFGYLLSPEFQQHQNTLFGSRPKQYADQTQGLFSWYAHIQEYLRLGGILHRIITQPGMLPSILLHDVINHLIDDYQIEKAKIPLSVIAADLKTGHVVMLEKGNLRNAVKGSSALPGIFPAVDFDGMQLSDVGNFLTLPSILAQAYQPEFSIIVEVSNEVRPLFQYNNAVDALVRMNEVGENFWRKHSRQFADLVIRPNVAHVEWFDFSEPHRLISLGREAALRALPEIEATMKRKIQTAQNNYPYQ